MSAARRPPHAVDAEEALLGALMISPVTKAAEVAGRVPPEAFYVPLHQKVAGAVFSLAAAGQSIDHVTVAGRLGALNGLAKAELLRLQVACPAAGSIDHYARIVSDHADRRRALALAADLTAAAYDTDNDDVFAQAVEAVAHFTPAVAGQARKLRLTLAAAIRPRPVRWLWDGRVPAGEVTLTPGRGGIGKSTFHAWMIAAVTTGSLPGAHHGTPHPVIVATSEDSWAHTVVPRLIVAGADLDLVYRADVVVAGGEIGLTLPADCAGLEVEINRIGARLLSVDPLMSVISGALDSHKDRDVRHALEPLHRLAERTGCAVLGNAHFNKGAGSDAINLVTGSAAFVNVARAALGFVRDPEAEDGSCVISQLKNNLGRVDLPSLRYLIVPATVDTDEGPAEVGRLVMVGESDRSVADILGDRDDPDEKSEAQEFLEAHVPERGWVLATTVLLAAKKEGLAERTVQRHRKKLRYRSQREGFGPGSIVWWGHPDAPLRASTAATNDVNPGPESTALTTPMGYQGDLYGAGPDTSADDYSSNSRPETWPINPTRSCPRCPAGVAYNACPHVPEQIRPGPPRSNVEPRRLAGEGDQR